MSQADILLEHLTVTAHEHNVIDDDQAFIVDPVTRKITTSNPDRFVLVQSDHNSKVFTFKIPRFIEGHDMALCDKVKVLYNNVESNSKKDKPTADGVYETSDLHIVDKNTVACSWEISDNATQYEGTLHFALLFLCMDGPVVTYRWGTDFYDDVVVLKKIGSELSFQLMHLDVIEQWKAAVKREFSVYIDQTVAGDVAVAKSELDEQLHNDMDARYAEISKVVNDKHAEIDEQIDTFDEILQRETTNMDNEIDVLKARMDTFTHLPDDSGASDAELTDIRVGADGRLYGSAGTAVRSASQILDNVKQRAYGSFESMEGVVHNDVVYQVEGKIEQSIGSGYYAEYKISDEKMLLMTGCSWSSFSIFPLAAFYNSKGELIKKIGHTEEKTFKELLVYVPIGAVRLVVNGKKWYEPAVKRFVSGDLENDISVIQKTLDSPILSTKLKSYEENGYESKTITLSSSNTELIELQMYTTEGGLTSGDIGSSTYDTLLFPVDIFESFLLDKYTIGVYGGAFLDADKKWISSFKTNYPDNLEPKIVPDKAHYIAITVHSEDRYNNIVGYFKTFEIKGLKIDPMNVFNLWTGKKVVWIGTSVSFGQYATKSYPDEAAKHLKFDLVNCSSPGVAIHTGVNNGSMKYGSLALSKEEYKAIGWTIPNEPVAYIPGGGYNDYYRTYENIFCEDNADADLYVFDVVPNNSNFDTSDWDLFDFRNWCYTDGSDFADHRTTFLGALLFLMDKMYALNENARMVFVLGSGFSYWEGKNAFDAVKGKWNIPVLDIWSKINTSPKSLSKIFSDNGTNGHPSTYAHELMGKMLAHDLKGIC